MNKYQLSNQLAKYVTPEKEEAINKNLPFCSDYLTLLDKALNKELEAKVAESEASFNYSQPNWELKQAELFGERRALRKVIQMLGRIND